jgi:hypothetical protein
MWGLSNRTKFRTDRTFVRDQSGAEVWIVAVRATFSIRPNGEVVAAPAEEQQDVCLAPLYFGPPMSSSLRYDTDLVRTKLGTDVLVHAHAHAPGGRAVKFVDVAFRVGPLTKALRVVGDRVWKKGILGLTASDPISFVQKPIRYECAWGGKLPQLDSFDSQNPVGRGRSARNGDLLPNCELLGRPVDSVHHTGPPAGFGPIPCHWQPRAGLAGTYDKDWQERRRPLVPTDFQDAYFQCAPPDQQVLGFLRGGEEVRLLNLTEKGRLDFRLPRIALGFSTRVDGQIVHHGARLHTVVIEPEKCRLIMVWQTALPCHHTLYTLEETLVFEKSRLGAREHGEADPENESDDEQDEEEENQSVDTVFAT